MLGSVRRVSRLALFPIVWMAAVVQVQAQSTGEAIDREAKAIEPKLIAWRRDIHQNPELGNREFRTSALVAEHLKKLGYEVREKVAHTGVVAMLKGGKPGPVVALRADMDALPVTEEVDLPFASKVAAQLARQGDRRDARLRPRRPHRHPDGRRRGIRQDAQRAARHRQADLPARRGRPAARRGGRSAPHAYPHSSASLVCDLTTDTEVAYGTRQG